MEQNVVHLDFFTVGGQRFARLDAEFAKPSLLIPEVNARKRNGTSIAELVVKYDGPTVNNTFKEDDDVIAYLDIDGVDTDDGLTYVPSFTTRIGRQEQSMSSKSTTYSFQTSDRNVAR